MIATAYASRGARLWIVTRLLMSAVLLLGEVDPLDLSALAAVESVLLSVVVCVVDVKLHRERALLGNLAISPVQLGLLFAIPAAIGEGALGVTVALIS